MIFLSQKNKPSLGFSLVEILMSISLFSIAMVGLYFSFNSVVSQTAQGLKGDVEAAYAKMLIGAVNLYDIDVETAYDVVVKTATTLPDGTTAYYTRDVRSDATTPDVKKISVYFYKKSTDTNPYRNFTKELSPRVWRYTFGHNAYNPKQYIDSAGNKYIHVDFLDSYTTATAGSYKFGYDNTLQGGAASTEWQGTTANGGDVNGSIDNNTSANNNLNSEQWRRVGRGSGASSNTLAIRFPASQDKTYKLTCGYNEFTAGVTAAGDRAMQISLNGSIVDTVDIFDEAGKYTALTKTYTVTPQADANGVYHVLYQCSPLGASPCTIAWASLEQQ